MLVHLGSSEEFKNLVSKGVVLVDMFATWCGPCRMLAPELEKLATEMPDLTIIKVDVDEFEELAEDYGVSAVPTLILFKEGKVAKIQPGFQSVGMLKTFVN